MDNTIPQGLDPTAFILTKSLKRSETPGSSDPYNQSGDNGTSTGAYQIQNKYWKPWAKQYLGDENAPMTEENQNKLAYTRVKSLLDAGNSQSQVASIWNHGSPDYQGVVGDKVYPDGAKIHYDVPAYVDKVQRNYQKIQSEIQKGFNPTPYSNPDSGQTQTQSSQNQINQTDQNSTLTTELKNRVSKGSEALTNTLSGKINPISGLLQGVGAISGGINDVAQKGLELIPGFKKAEGWLGQGIQSLAKTSEGQEAVNGIGSFVQEHPELADDIGAIGNIAGVALLGTGIGKATGIAVDSIGKAVGEDTASAIAKEVADQATKDMAGTTKSGVFGRIKQAVSQDMLDTSKTVTKAVPNFGKLGTATEKIEAIKNAVGKGSGKAFTQKEVTALDNVIKVLQPQANSEIGSTAFSRAHPLIRKAVKGATKGLLGKVGVGVGTYEGIKGLLGK